MANKKISELTSATLPLSGTELIPIVQGGVTKKVASSEVTGDFIPLSGTTVGNPVTGDVEFEDFTGIVCENTDENKSSFIGFEDGNSVLKTTDTISGYFASLQSVGNSIEVTSSNPLSVGLLGATDFSTISPSNKLIYAQRQYVDNALSASVSGTTNRISKFTASGVVGDSQIFDNGTNVGVGTTSPSAKFEVNGVIKASNSFTNALGLNLGTTNSKAQLYQSQGVTLAYFSGSAITNGLVLTNTGSIGIGTETPQARLDIRAQGALATDVVFRVRNSADTLNSLVVLGNGSVYNNGAGGISSNLVYGLEALNVNTTGYSNTALGYRALYTNTTGNRNLAVGNGALNLNTTGILNTALGTNALFNNTTGGENMALGYNALFLNTTGTGNVGIGNSALYNNSIGTANTALGQNALLLNTTGNTNTGIGGSSLYSNTTGNGNLAVGSGSLQYNTTGSTNIGIGTEALRNNIDGNENIAVGYRAGRYFGTSGFVVNTKSDYSIFIGKNTRPLDINEFNQIVIGTDAVGAGSNTATLGNTSIVDTVLRGRVNLTQYTTGSRPAYVKGALIYDSTLGKLVVGGNSGWEVVTSI